MQNLQAIEFQNETREILEDIKMSLVELSEQPDNQTILYRNYLYWHEIKSLATLFNLDPIATLAHEIEGQFDKVTTQKKSLGKESIQWLGDSLEFIKTFLQDKIYNKPLEQDYNKLVTPPRPATAAATVITKPLASHPPAKTAAPKPAKKSTGNRKILIVEDEPINRKLLKATIKNMGQDLEIISVDSAEEGLFHFFTDKFSLIFLDIMMPVIDGNDFIAIAEKNLLKKNVPSPCNIVVQTAIQSMSQLTTLARKECVQEIIRKPISPERVHDCIERYCS